jgi:hypothetical protein
MLWFTLAKPSGASVFSTSLSGLASQRPSLGFGCIYRAEPEQIDTAEDGAYLLLGKLSSIWGRNN